MIDIKSYDMISINDIIYENMKKNKHLHSQIMRILHNVTVGEIFYACSDGGYYHYADDNDVWNQEIHWSDTIDWVLSTGYEFMITGVHDKNREVTLCVLLSDINGEWQHFSNRWSETNDGAMFPLLRLNLNGTETFYEGNINSVLDAIDKMKKHGTYETRKHWYD